jgi:hypothetical protein
MSTSANCQSGWSTFRYTRYAIRHGDAGFPPPTSISILDELLGVESYLQHQRFIAYADLATKVLWAFEADEGSGNFAKEVPDLDHISRFQG